jgi:inward rectifier potassium channel
VRLIGLRRRPLADLYHRLVTGSWWRLVGVYAAVYFATQAAFAAAHLALAAEPGAGGGGLLAALVAAVDAPPAPAAPLSPRWLAAGAVSALEGFVRWLELGVGAAVIIAKASRIPARVLFSDVAVVAPHEGGRALLFRMANERTSHVVDAKVAAMLVRNEVSDDGEIVRRAYDLALARGGSALFSHAWTAVHPVGADSPFSSATEASLAEAEAELVVTLSGYDEGLTRVIHARHVYPARQIRWGERFAEIVKVLPTGGRVVDYRKFHRTLPADGETTPPRGRGSR